MVPGGHAVTLEQFFTALGGGGLVGGVIAIVAKWLRPPEDRKALEAAASKDMAAGGSAIIAATAEAFTEVTASLREEIERLQRVAVTFETDLASAHARAVALEGQVAQLTGDLARVRAERDAALDREQIANEKLEQANGQIRQLQQVIASSSAARQEGVA